MTNISAIPVPLDVAAIRPYTRKATDAIHLGALDWVPINRKG